jgi:hypothetical protein
MGHRQATPGTDIPSAHCQTAAQGVARQLFSAMGIERDNKDSTIRLPCTFHPEMAAPACQSVVSERRARPHLALRRIVWPLMLTNLVT